MQDIHNKSLLIKETYWKDVEHLSFLSPLWTTLQMTGASRWSGWRSKTSSCLFSYRGPWRLRLKPAARPEPRWGGSATPSLLSFMHTVFPLWLLFPPAFLLKVIAAEGEMNASRALKEASLVIAESPSALQLRYLQTLNTIAAEKNSTIIFPLPLEMMQGFIKQWRGDLTTPCYTHTHTHINV